MAPTWLVTGAAGFLGTNAGLWLKGRATRVAQVRTSRIVSPFDQESAIDLRDAAAVRRLVTTVRPDVILHAAAVSGHETCQNDPEQALAVNVGASGALAAAAAECGSRIIYISTDAVFSGQDGDYRETDDPEPFSFYGETKLAGERAVLDSGARALVVRTNFFGWSSSGSRSVLEFFVNALRAGQPVKGYPDFVVTSIYVRSLLDAIWRLDEAGAGGVVHVASSDALSKHDFGVAVAEEFELDPDLISPSPASLGDHATSRSRDISLNTDLLASILGIRPQDQRSGIRQARAEESSVGAALHRMEEDQ